MTDTFTPEERRRLRVPLDHLHRFNPIGLTVATWTDYARDDPDPSGFHTFVAWSNDRPPRPLVVRAPELNRNLRPEYRVHGVMLCRTASADLGFESTVDKLTRWLARQVRVPVTCGARWVPLVPIGSRGSWALYGDDGHQATFGRDRWHEVHALDELDPNDDRRLLSGARFVDMLALALVASSCP